ncbi:MAG: hydrolase [bacterium]|nr:hydrolase [bacterium]
MKIRAIQFSPLLGNLSENFDFHIREIEKAVTDKMNLVVFPELSLSGYHLKDILFDITLSLEDRMVNRFKQLSRKIDILVGAPVEEEGGVIYNCALYFSGGRLLHNHRKVQLPNFGMFEEQMIFKAGERFQSFRIEDFTVGIVICREILFPSTAYLYFLQGVDFLIGISNSPFRGIADVPDGFTSFKLWERMGEVFSIHHHMNYVFVNRTGFEDGIGFGGGSFLAAPGKGIVRKAAYFDAETMDVEIDTESVRRARLGGNYLRDAKPGVVLNELKRILNA